MFKLTPYKNNPILKPKGDSFESLCVLNPAVIYDDKNNEFVMLYRAAPKDDIMHHIYLGLATSKDGFNFERKFDHPVLSPTLDGEDAGCVEDPRLVKIGDWYYVTYASRPYAPGRYWLDEPKPWFNPPKEGPAFLKYNNSITYLAITQDFINYKKLGRITKTTEDDRDVFIFPEQVNGKWVRFSRPLYNFKDYGLDKPGILIAYSNDLMEWENPVKFCDSLYDFESAKMGGSTPPLKTKDGWLFLYHGVSKDDSMYRVGAMLLDLDNPSKILCRTKDPILEPIKEEGSIYSGCVFPTGNVIKDGILYVYYGINDHEIGVATCELDKLLTYLKEECRA